MDTDQQAYLDVEWLPYVADELSTKPAQLSYQLNYVHQTYVIWQVVRWVSQRVMEVQNEVITEKEQRLQDLLLRKTGLHHSRREVRNGRHYEACSS